MDLYVLRFRDYPCIPILFGWDCNPINPMEGSGSLHKYNRPIDPISVLSKFIRSQYILKLVKAAKDPNENV